MNNDFVRRSPDGAWNDQLLDTSGSGGGERKAGREDNASWLAKQKMREGVLLLGGVSIDHFRIRFSQSRYRDDLAPSLWSMAGILTSRGTVLTVPTDRLPDTSSVPVNNAVHELDFAAFADPERFPNIAVLSFSKDLEEVEAAAQRIRSSRALIDLPAALVTWLSYAWAVDASGNPLHRGIGVPSAAFVEAAYASAGVEISPAQRTASSSPEAIWQAARWWSSFYKAAKEFNKKSAQPHGSYCIRQPAAAAVGARDRSVGNVITPAEEKQSTAPAAEKRRAPPRKRK